jgi:serine/threonine protein kinase
MVLLIATLNLKIFLSMMNKLKSSTSGSVGNLNKDSYWRHHVAHRVMPP